MSRPTIYTDELALTICERLAEGSTLRELCRQEDMPGRSTVFRWLEEKPAFRDRYARACEWRAESWGDELLDIADDGSLDYVATEDGERFDGEHVQRSKLRVDTRKWLMSKAAPKKYGDKVTNELTGADGGAIQVETLTPNERARRIAFALAQGARAAKGTS